MNENNNKYKKLISLLKSGKIKFLPNWKCDWDDTLSEPEVMWFIDAIEDHINNDGSLYIRSLNGIIPSRYIETRENFHYKFKGVPYDGDEIPKLEVTEEGEKLFMERQEIENKPFVTQGDGSTYIVGNITNSKITNKKSVWNWCKSNKLSIGSIGMNLYFIIKYWM